MISIFGALAVLGFLVRNLFARPRLIAEAEFPDYMRASCNMSYAVCLFCILPWTAAALEASDFGIWATLMVSPLVFMLVLAQYTKRWTERQSPEIREYVQEQARNSSVARFAERHRQS